MIIPHNIYFHVPFCASKCNYCAFYSAACANPDWDGYFNKISGEIEYWSSILGNIAVPTIFFGGGTPSLMPTNIMEKIIKSVKQNFTMPPDIEISMESNPGTINLDRLSEFKSIGINRISVGVQSMDDKTLVFMGRRHSVAQSLQLIDSAINLGLRTSGDFIYGLPEQSVTDIRKLCQQINQMGLQHCSMYELSLESGTPFAKMNLQLPDNDTMTEMYLAIQSDLNLPRYEISNYATPGQECRHNQNIWDGQPYIGIGDGACGRVFNKGVWYEQIGNGKKFTPLDTATRAREKVITGLRTTNGVYLDSDVRAVIDLTYCEKNPELLSVVNDRIIATEKGLLILDNLLLDLVK